MIKGCSKIFFFGIIISAAVYYFIAEYEMDNIIGMKERLKTKLVDETIAGIKERLADVEIKSDKIDTEGIVDFVADNLPKVDTKFIEDFYSEFSKFISDKALDSQEIEKLKKLFENYEKSASN